MLFHDSTQWMGFHIVYHLSLTTFLAVDVREFWDYGSYSLCSWMKALLLANVWYSRMTSLISYTDVYLTGLQFLNSCLMFSAYECRSISGVMYRWWVANCVQFLFCSCSFCSCLFLVVDMLLLPEEILWLIKRQWESHRITTRYFTLMPLCLSKKSGYFWFMFNGILMSNFNVVAVSLTCSVIHTRSLVWWSIQDANDSWKKL